MADISAGGGAPCHPRVMVGDRFHDGEVAMKASIPFIGCTYGFGDDEELAMASARVSAPEDIFGAVQEVLS